MRGLERRASENRPRENPCVKSALASFLWKTCPAPWRGRRFRVPWSRVQGRAAESRLSRPSPSVNHQSSGYQTPLLVSWSLADSLVVLLCVCSYLFGVGLEDFETFPHSRAYYSGRVRHPDAVGIGPHLGRLCTAHRRVSPAAHGLGLDVWRAAPATPSRRCEDGVAHRGRIPAAEWMASSRCFGRVGQQQRKIRPRRARTSPRSPALNLRRALGLSDVSADPRFSRVLGTLEIPRHRKAEQDRIVIRANLNTPERCEGRHHESNPRQTHRWSS